MNRDEFEFGFDPEEEQEARRPKGREHRSYLCPCLPSG